MRVNGPFSFDDEGYLTAKFELVFVQHMELLKTLQRLFPEQANNLQALFFVLSAMPKNADGFPVLSLLITHGRAKQNSLNLVVLHRFELERCVLKLRNHACCKSKARNIEIAFNEGTNAVCYIMNLIFFCFTPDCE